MSPFFTCHMLNLYLISLKELFLDRSRRNISSHKENLNQVPTELVTKVSRNEFVLGGCCELGDRRLPASFLQDKEKEQDPFTLIGLRWVFKLLGTEA